MVRHFGNTNMTRKPNGTIEENGCGKFQHVNDSALTSLRQLGITHIWLTGVLEHASGTAYPNRPADSPLILKGKAGSPYAIRDYFDVCPDYAEIPENRLLEFKSLLKRIKSHGLQTLIDFVPNHVSRCYNSDIFPELNFGTGDDPSQFFAPDNNFFYLNNIHPGGGPPLRLPNKRATDEGSIVFEDEIHIGKVTGNNAITWSPSIHDWYETIKLNYGHDFTVGSPRDDIRPLPDSESPREETPDTWQKMDSVLSYWQEMGVDGFRVDMAHMIPMAYWQWQIKRCRDQDANCFFIAEAYDGDPAKLTEGNVLDALLDAGFDAVYDSPPYDTVKQTVEGIKWANDIDTAADPFSERFHQVVRYAENHDEVRIASAKNWAKSNNSILAMQSGRAASAILFGMGKGPIMLYNGQEIGEHATGAEGFSGDDGRSSIFDYGALPEFSKWVNNHRYDGELLSQEQKELRLFYRRLLNTCKLPAFTHGDFYGLNHNNLQNPHYGRLADESASGHWLYCFLRRDKTSGQAFLIVANLHPHSELSSPVIHFSDDVLHWLQETAGSSNLVKPTWEFTDHLGSDQEYKINAANLSENGLQLLSLPASSARCFEIS